MVYGFIVFIALFFIGFLISIITLCQPFSRYWNVLGPGHCGSLSGSQIATSSINVVVDLAIVVLPLPVLWKLQMPRQKKLKVMGIFAVGAMYVRNVTDYPRVRCRQADREFSICLINIARLVSAVVLDQEDFSYNLSAGSILTALEVEIGIINASLPTINPIFTRNSKHKEKAWKLQPIGGSWGANRSSLSRKPLRFNRIQNSAGESTIAVNTENTKASFHSSGSHEGIKVTRDMTVQFEGAREG